MSSVTSTSSTSLSLSSRKRSSQDLSQALSQALPFVAVQLPVGKKVKLNREEMLKRILLAKGIKGKGKTKETEETVLLKAGILTLGERLREHGPWCTVTTNRIGRECCHYYKTWMKAKLALNQLSSDRKVKCPTCTAEIEISLLRTWVLSHIISVAELRFIFRHPKLATLPPELRNKLGFTPDNLMLRCPDCENAQNSQNPVSRIPSSPLSTELEEYFPFRVWELVDRLSTTSRICSVLRFLSKEDKQFFLDIVMSSSPLTQEQRSELHSVEYYYRLV